MKIVGDVSTDSVVKHKAYDKALRKALNACEAKQGIFIVVEGKHGMGMVSKLTTFNHQAAPESLRRIADQIESGFQAAVDKGENLFE